MLTPHSLTLIQGRNYLIGQMDNLIWHVGPGRNRHMGDTWTLQEVRAVWKSCCGTLKTSKISFIEHTSIFVQRD
jgi:hypothetical protein